LPTKRSQFIVLVGAAANVAGVLWQWPSAGRTERNGFQLARALSALGSQLDLSSARVVAGLWYLIPLASAIAVLALGLHHRGTWLLTSALAVVAALIAVGSLWASSQVGLSGNRRGPLMCVVGALLIAAGALDCRRQRTISDV
jgi:hypothetical protein